MTAAAVSHAPRRSARVRVVTAASLFDGHDAAINIMRRILQSQGAEVIHLGHDRSVEEIVTAAIQEDAHAVAVSSYQGGHIEFFQYMVDRLRELGAAHIRVFGGGGGTIIPEETKTAGTHSAKWDGTNARDRFAGTGLYIYLFRVDDGSATEVIRKPIAIINK